MKTYRIYLITNIAKKFDNVYIGQTCKTIKQRFKEHINSGITANENLDNQKNVYALHRAIHKYGPDSFTITLVEDNISEEEIDEKEIYYIKLYDSYNHGYNETTGGQGVHGYEHTEKSKQKISNKSKELWLKWKDDKDWLENRNNKISISQKGQKKSDEHCKKLSEVASKRIGDKNPFYGKHHSDETKQKLSKSHSIPIIMYSINDEILNEFESAHQAILWLKSQNLVKTKTNSTSLIIRCCKNKCKFAYGYKWRYKNKV